MCTPCCNRFKRLYASLCCDEHAPRHLQAEREPALKIVVMSATLDAAAFARFFGNANTVYLQVLAGATLLQSMRRLSRTLKQGLRTHRAGSIQWIPCTCRKPRTATSTQR